MWHRNINLFWHGRALFPQITLNLHYLWVGPLQAVVIIIFLWYEIGPSCLAGLSAIALMVPVQTWFGKLFGIFRWATKNGNAPHYYFAFFYFDLSKDCPVLFDLFHCFFLCKGAKRPCWPTTESASWTKWCPASGSSRCTRGRYRSQLWSLTSEGRDEASALCFLCFIPCQTFVLIIWIITA